MSKQEMWSVIATAVIGVIASIGAVMSMQSHSVLALAVWVGALGGLAHEIAQSGGKIMFFQHHDDGLYLGSVAGVVLGAVAGLLVVRGHLTTEAGQATTDATMVQLAYEIFTAGLALKGVTEAAGGSPVKTAPPGGGGRE